jgi:hypothetical protein
MCSAALVLSLLAAIDPVRIGITAVLISRPRPMLNLLIFWLGGVMAAIAVAFVVLVTFRDVTLSLMRGMVWAVESPSVAYIRAALGALAVSIAALIMARFWARQSAHLSVIGGESALLVPRPNTRTGSSRLSMHSWPIGGSLLVAFVAGLALATPPVEYMAAIIAIVATEPTHVGQVGAALLFTLVAFTVVEVPLITYLTSPAQTLAVVRRLNDWISPRRQAIPAVVIGAIGCTLLVSGIGGI